MAGLRDKGNGVGDLCVRTDPVHRSKGRGTAVVRAATAATLAEGTLVLYQTLEANVGSVALALSVGFERYANHVAVRLARERP